MLSANNISFSRKSRPILSNVSCALTPGKLTSLIGANGSGKSTLFKMFTGELQPDHGFVAFDGKALADWPAKELARRRAALSQENALAFPFKAQEVVALGRFPHTPNGETRSDLEIARAALKEVDLEGFENRRFTQLSGGEKQRIQLARALAQIWPPEKTKLPSVLLLDEPTASLDPAHQALTLAIARKLADAGNAVLAILHDMNLAIAYADNLWALKDERLIADGPVETTLTPDLARTLFDIDCRQVTLPDHPRPQFVTLPR